jgi:hypothetical protein
MEISDAEMYKALMETTVVKFQNVSSLSIILHESSSRSSQTHRDALLVNAYIACASNLRKLTLSTRSADFNKLFPLTPSMLTSLEEVTLTFTAHWRHPIANIEAVPTFFQAIASTLTTLNITFTFTDDEPSRLLESFPCHGNKAVFPKLTTLSLFHSNHPASPSLKLLQFLDQHAYTLKHLSLQHTELSSIASQSLHDLDALPVLPHLETLNLHNGSICRCGYEFASTRGLDLAWAYAQHSRSTLESLSLTNCSLTLYDLGRLLDRLGQESKGGGLNSLVVTVQALSPQMLDLLAEKLPQLERLKIDFGNLRSNDSADVPTWTKEHTPYSHLTHEVQPCVSRSHFVRPI